MRPNDKAARYVAATDASSVPDKDCMLSSAIHVVRFALNMTPCQCAAAKAGSKAIATAVAFDSIVGWRRVALRHAGHRQGQRSAVEWRRAWRAANCVSGSVVRRFQTCSHCSGFEGGMQTKRARTLVHPDAGGLGAPPPAAGAAAPCWKLML